MTNLTSTIQAAGNEKRERALKTICEGALEPAFGAVTKKELELLVFDALITIGFLSTQPAVYEVMQKLRVTRSRARGLLFDRDVRRHSTEELDRMARAALEKPLLQGQGYAVALDIENPLLADHMRETLRQLGHATDGSFSPSLVKLNDDAAGALVEHYVPKSERKNVLHALHKAGIADKSIKGVVRAVLRKGAGKLAGGTGDAIAGDVGEFVGKLLEANADAITKVARGLVETLGVGSGADAGA